MTVSGTDRRQNQDAFLADTQLGLFVVWDGVGGRPSGAHAAAVASASIREHVRDAMASRARDVGPPIDVVRRAMEHASRTLVELGRADLRHAGMCTTAAVVLVFGRHAVIGHVGNTRVYRARGRSIDQLTEDHTIGALRARRDPPGATRPRVRKSPITRALGLGAAVEVDIHATHLMAGDRLLLCTDGFYEHFPPATALTRLLGMDPEAATIAAMNHLRQRGGGDDATAIFVEAPGHA